MAVIKGISLNQSIGKQPFVIIEDNYAIKESIFNILTTRKGEIPGNPAFGTSIYKYLFEPNLEQFWEALKLEIIKDIQDFEPRAYITNVEFLEDNNNLTLFVFFVSLLEFTQDAAIISNLQP